MNLWKYNIQNLFVFDLKTKLWLLRFLYGHLTYSQKWSSILISFLKGLTSWCCVMTQ